MNTGKKNNVRIIRTINNERNTLTAEANHIQFTEYYMYRNYSWLNTFTWNFMITVVKPQL